MGMSLLLTGSCYVEVLCLEAQLSWTTWTRKHLVCETFTSYHYIYIVIFYTNFRFSHEIIMKPLFLFTLAMIASLQILLLRRLGPMLSWPFVRFLFAKYSMMASIHCKFLISFVSRFTNLLICDAYSSLHGRNTSWNQFIVCLTKARFSF